LYGNMPYIYYYAPLAIENVRTGFPDCRATDSSSHFVRDDSERTEKCDWIICWRDDLETKPPKFPQVVALDDIVERVAPALVLNRFSAAARPVDVFRARAAGLPIRQQRIIEQLMTFGGTEGLRIDWPETNGACFTVRGPVARLPRAVTWTHSIATSTPESTGHLAP
jgi:hypothetical protein